MSIKYLFKVIILVILIIVGFIFLKSEKIKSNHYPLVTFTDSEVIYKGKTIETIKNLPYLFIRAPLERDVNAKYSYSIFNDIDTNTEFLRLDKNVVQSGTAWFDNASAFYTLDKQTGNYKNVLVSSKGQSLARFPETTIINRNKTIIKFYFDVSRPYSCFGPDCRSYWADFYQWDSFLKQFVNIDSEFLDYYKDLLAKYRALDKEGCNLGDNESLGYKTLSEVYLLSKTDYCKLSSREELEKYWYYKNKLEQLLDLTGGVNYICKNNKKINVKADKEKAEVLLDDNRKFVLSSTTSASGARYATRSDKLLNEENVFWSKAKTAFFEEKGKITYESCEEVLNRCDLVSENQALDIVRNLPEVKNYFNTQSTNSSGSKIRIYDASGSSQGFNIWSIQVYSDEKDNGGGHTATFNWYSVDKCTGEIKCSFSNYDKHGKLLKVNENYPCE